MADDTMSERPILRPEELAAWTADRPDASFVERVLGQIDEAPVVLTLADRRPTRARRWPVVAAAAAAVGMAAALVLWIGDGGTALHGGGRYEQGAIVTLAERGIVEVGETSEIVWVTAPSGEVRVTQSRGATKYDVTAGPRVAVATPFGVATFDDATTTISVGTLPGATVVEVHRGVVDVAGPHDRASVGVGERRVLSDEPTQLASSETIEREVDPTPMPDAAKSPQPPRRGTPHASPMPMRAASPGEPTPEPSPGEPTPAPSAPEAAPSPAAPSGAYGLSVKTSESTRYAVHCKSAYVESSVSRQGDYVLHFDSATEMTCKLRLRSRGSLSYELKTRRGTKRGRLEGRTRKTVIRI